MLDYFIDTQVTAPGAEAQFPSPGCVYRLTWEQSMGGGRAIVMSITATDLETARHVWRTCCRDRDTEVRDVRAAYCSGTRRVGFNPAVLWPRPLAIDRD